MQDATVYKDKMSRGAIVTTSILYSLPYQVLRLVAESIDRKSDGWCKFGVSLDELTHSFHDAPLIGTRAGHKVNALCWLTAALMILGAVKSVEVVDSWLDRIAAKQNSEALQTR